MKRDCTCWLCANNESEPETPPETPPETTPISFIDITRIKLLILWLKLKRAILKARLHWAKAKLMTLKGCAYCEHCSKLAILRDYKTEDNTDTIMLCRDCHTYANDLKV